MAFMKPSRIASIIIIILIFVAVLVTFWNLSIGNRQIFDTAMHFDHAMIKLADGEIVEGRVDSWMDFENSDQIQVTVNGTTYLIHSTNATLIKN